jgi:hypothetical protein
VHWIHKICRPICNHVKIAESRVCSGFPYSKIWVVRTVQNSHVTVFCSIPLVFRKSGVLRTENGAACRENFDSGHFELFNILGRWLLRPAFLAGIKPCDVIMHKVYCVRSFCRFRLKIDYCSHRHESPLISFTVDIELAFNSSRRPRPRLHMIILSKSAGWNNYI